MAKKQNNAHVSGVYVYLGPSIRGVIQKGTVFHGAKGEIVKRFSSSEMLPDIEKLIVPDKELISVKSKIEKGGNPYSYAYRRLSNAT